MSEENMNDPYQNMVEGKDQNIMDQVKQNGLGRATMDRFRNDTKDSDATNTHNKSVSSEKPVLQKESVAFIKAAKFVKDGGKIEDILTKYRISKEV